MPWMSSVRPWKCVPIWICPTITTGSWPRKGGTKTAQMQSRSCEKLLASTRTFHRLITSWAKPSYRRARRQKPSSSLTKVWSSIRTWQSLIISSPASIRSSMTGFASRSSFGSTKRQTKRQNRKISFSAWKFRLRSLDKGSSTRRLACVLGLVLELSVPNTAAPQQRPDKPNPAAQTSLSKQISLAEAAVAQRPQDPQVLMRLVKLYQAEGEFGKSLPVL